MSNNKLIKETETMHRLKRSNTFLKKSISNKVDALLSSGEYYENGYFELFS